MGSHCRTHHTASAESQQDLGRARSECAESSDSNNADKGRLRTVRSDRASVSSLTLPGCVKHGKLFDLPKPWCLHGKWGDHFLRLVVQMT